MYLLSLCTLHVWLGSDMMILRVHYVYDWAVAWRFFVYISCVTEHWRGDLCVHCVCDWALTWRSLCTFRVWLSTDVAIFVYIACVTEHWRGDLCVHFVCDLALTWRFFVYIACVTEHWHDDFSCSGSSIVCWIDDTSAFVSVLRREAVPQGNDVT